VGARLAHGLSNGEIAELRISVPTVKSHVSSVLAKTGTRTRVYAAVFAYESAFTRPGT
jgi:DNA-binding NarL/FixJ family response regulator